MNERSVSGNRAEAAIAPLHVAPQDSPPSPHTGRIRYLDGWRGVSIFLVLAGHTLRSESLADLGVQMFFALSGRLMADILFVEHFPLRSFYRRRISRIYPGLLVFVVLTYFLVRGTTLSFKPLAALLGLTFLLNYGLVLGHGVAAIENLWSLCVEEHSYMLLGMLAFLLRRRKMTNPTPLLAAIACASIVDGLFCACVLHQSGRAIYWRTDAQLAPIFLAAAAYLWFRTRRAAGWLPLMCLCGGALAQLSAPLLGYSLGTILLALAVASLDEAPLPILKALSWRPLAMLGVCSYSIYLWQQPFYRYSLLHALSPWLALLLGMFAGGASFYLIERPARHWLNRNWRSVHPPRMEHAVHAIE